jgi:hypothetical protein
MLLRAGEIDIATIALWLGQESIKTTYIYQHADPALKHRKWLTGSRRSAPSPADTGHPTPCSRSSKASDYALRPTNLNRAQQRKPTLETTRSA